MLDWAGVLRLGLVNYSIGSITVLMVSTLNRVMVVELGLPALVPGLLVGFYYVLQISRPGWGHRSDMGGRRTPLMLTGIAVMSLGAMLAAQAIGIFPDHRAAGLALSTLAYGMIGLGAGAAGTSLLALVAVATPQDRRAGASTIVWLMLVFGIATTAAIVGRFLDPYSPARLLGIVGAVAAAATLLSIVALAGVERRLPMTPPETHLPLREGLTEIWREPPSRRFALFVFLSITAYFLQDLILEPYAGLVFGFTPGQTTSMQGVQSSGVFAGMATAGLLATGLRIGSLRNWVRGGCIGSAAALTAIALAGPLEAGRLLPLVAALGFSNGVFAVAMIAAMMRLASNGRSRREGTRLGIWGAAQALASGFGGLIGAAAVDVLRLFLPVRLAFTPVFMLEAVLFLLSAVLASRAIVGTGEPQRDNMAPNGEML